MTDMGYMVRLEAQDADAMKVAAVPGIQEIDAQIAFEPSWETRAGCPRRPSCSSECSEL